MAALSFSCFEYYNALIPDWQALAAAAGATGWVPKVSLAAAMALYWKWFQPDIVPVVLDESVMTERQKALVALRTAVTTVTTLSQMFTSSPVVKAQSGTDMVEFEERNKIYRAIMPLWTTNLKDMEAAEGIFFNLLQNVPGLLMKLEPDYGPFDPAVGYVFANGAYYVNYGRLD